MESVDISDSHITSQHTTTSPRDLVFSVSIRLADNLFILGYNFLKLKQKKKTIGNRCHSIANSEIASVERYQKDVMFNHMASVSLNIGLIGD